MILKQTFFIDVIFFHKILKIDKNNYFCYEKNKSYQFDMILFNSK